MTLVRQIARRHGGEARIDGPDGTSRVVVTLPLRPPGLRPRPTAAQTTGAP
jgi:signal transduction histidine kinase